MRLYTKDLNSPISIIKNGFTVIEVLIVLAIATLILSLIFLAVPALKRSHHNYVRKDFVTRTLAAEQQFFADNGRYPSCDSAPIAPAAIKCTPAVNAQANAIAFLNGYLPDGFDPATGTYHDPVLHSDATIVYPDTDNIYYVFDAHAVDHSVRPEPGIIYILAGHWCNANHPDGTSNLIAGDDASINRFAILIGLDQGFFCLDNITQ